ncbi:MAG: hypothetical protein JZU47_19460 [Prolixibacteraceae bacterium]|nr:hypothetical protein [Prolixibacteraceae bacterium]
MSERKLTPEEIENLYEFCYFRSVFHYDVQVEIVDHLASAIEELWKTNPELPFEETVYMLGEQFGGDLGFAQIKREKEKALRKKYRRLLWQYVGDFYKFPKIMITLLLSLSTYTALIYTENDQWIFILLLVLFIGFSLFYNSYYKRTQLKLQIKEGYTFLLNEISLKGALYYTGITSGILFSRAIHESHFSPVGNVIFSVFISMYMVLLYGDCFFIAKKIKEHFEEQFPQFVES